MGFRKATNTSSEQDYQKPEVGNGFSSPLEGHNKSPSADLPANLLVQPDAIKQSTVIGSPVNVVEQPTCSKPGKAGFIHIAGSGVKSSQGFRRKGSTLGPKNKRMHIDNEDSMELKLTWEEAQQLLCPPPNHAPSVVVVEGHEFEEYEEAPVLGKRTYFTKDQSGVNCQWAQCEDCSKWRKIPVEALLPCRWTCSNNTWDPDRSSCSSAQETSLEQIADLVSPKAGSSSRGKIKVETDNTETMGGLDTLANLAILEGATTQQTTRHPRHRPGCTCIVCIQPPSGKGPKHKQTCACNVCITVRRRFKTLMQRREKRQSEKEAEAARKQQEASQPQGLSPQAGSHYSPAAPSVKGSQRASVSNSPKKVEAGSCLVVGEGSKSTRASPPLKASQIDLNIQPEREEEPSPKYDAANTMRLIRDAAA